MDNQDRVIMSNKIKPIKVVWKCKSWDKMTQEERRNAKWHLDRAFDFIFTQTLLSIETKRRKAKK